MEKALFEPQDLSRVSPLLAVFVLALLVMRFLVVVIIAKQFGMTELADVLFVAQLIPITLFLQNRKALMFSVIPVYTEYIVNADDREVWNFTGQFTNLFVMAGMIVTVLYVLLAPYLIHVLTLGFTPEQRLLTTQLTRLLAPIILFLIIFSLAESLLYSYKHFTTTSWSIIFGVLGGLLGLVYLTERYGVFGYGYGSLAGYFLQFVIPLCLFWKYRKNFTLSLDLKDPGIQKLYKLLLPIYVYSVLTTLIHMTSRAMATTLGPGSVSAFQYAMTLTGVFPFVLTQTILAPLFPIVSEKVVKKEIESLKDLLVRGTQVLFFAVAPIVVVLICLSVPVIRLLFQRGEFKAEDTIVTANALMFSAPFILAMTLNMLYSQLIVNLGLIQSAAKLVLLLLFLNFLLCLGLMRFLDVGGIALALTLVFLLMAWIFILFVRHRIGPIGFGRCLKPGMKVLAACLFSALPLFYLSPYLESSWDMSRWSFQLSGLVLQGGLFFSLYGLFVWIFRMEEANILFQMVKKKEIAAETAMTTGLGEGN